ncbi:IPT/TIG domain-containing protein, partial [Streptomyces sp. ME03-5709C]|nr:IPT/TIG domain-containing protein [Streptomyces sp. ME03-5709C]
TTGGTAVTLTGTGLSGATAVRFGSTPAVSYTVNSATQITAVAPPGSPGGVLVTVVSPTGTSNAVSYTYTAVVVPALTALTPASGPTTGGTTVTLTGTGLSGATAVRFGSTPAVSYTVNSATQITAVAPPGSPGGVLVTVVSPTGTSNAVSYTYTAVVVPALTALTPASGPTTGGTAVTLTGTGLSGATAVRFGSTPAVSYTVNSATQITAVAPPGSPGG